MAGYNRIVVIGNLTRDPDYKQLPSGQAVCRLSVAINRQFKNRQTGSMIQEVCYVDIDVWGAQADSCRQYLQKGRPVLAEGRLKLDSWKDAEGQNRSKHSIVADRVIFLGSGQGAETGDIATEEIAPAARVEAKKTVEQDILNQIDAITQKKKGSIAPAPIGGIEFADEPPFQDELPF